MIFSSRSGDVGLQLLLPDSPDDLLFYSRSVDVGLQLLLPDSPDVLLYLEAVRGHLLDLPDTLLQYFKNSSLLSFRVHMLNLKCLLMMYQRMVP
jgi:hypothetical protein